MESENKKIIVDSNNKILISSKKKFVNFIKENIWKILGSGIAASVLIFNIIEFIATVYYSELCEEYYGVYWKYFLDSDIFKISLINLGVLILTLIYPIFFIICNKKMKSKIYYIVSFLITAFLMFYQNIVYTSNMLKDINSDFVNKVIDNIYVMIIFAISDLIISFYLFISKSFQKMKRIKVKNFEIIILTIATIIFAINISIGLGSIASRDISNKRKYEVLNNQRVIIAVYNNQFVVMNCKIKDKELFIKKNEGYELIDMKGKRVNYIKFEEVNIVD